MIRPKNRAELEASILQLLQDSMQGKVQLVSIPDEIIHDALVSEKPATLSEDENATLWRRGFCASEETLDCLEKDGHFKFRRKVLA